ncbi:MAG TPA: archaetidylserine decarboxylase [Longimicrobiaceae bacterium]|nr:archaetidylserine decarboxylase [Longimicrobiaceae bacterium]
MSTRTEPTEIVPDVSPEIPTGTWRVMLALLGRLPQGALSRSFGRIADVRLPPPLRRPVLGAFARAVGIEVSEAEQPLEAYGSLNEFFVRRLRPGLRQWPDDPSVAGSPVDGVMGQLGRIDAGRLLQAKGRWYSAAELLEDAEQARRFEGGIFATIYLSPRHYHRIHTPCGGIIRHARHVPGALLPVNAPSVAHVPDLFARNERLLCYVDGPLGRVAVVAVGAYNVGRISAAFDPLWNAEPGDRRGVTNRRRVEGDVREYDPPVRVRQGDEIMAFHLGSTVVLLFEPGRAELAPGVRPGRELRLGEPIAEPQAQEVRLPAHS